MQVSLMTFRVQLFKKKKRKGIQRWLGGRVGRKRGRVYGWNQIKDLVSFSEDAENIKGAGVSFLHTLRLRAVRKLPNWCPSISK